jgi:hypothetical protein
LILIPGWIDSAGIIIDLPGEVVTAAKKSGIALAASALLAVGITFSQGGATAATPRASGSSATERVIVVLRNQLASTPAMRSTMAARTKLANGSQDSVLASLTGRTPSKVVHLSLGNAFVATVTTAQAAALSANPAVGYVVKDAKVAAGAPAAASPGAVHSSAPTKVRPNVATDPFAVCPTDPSQPLVEPEALSSIHAYSSDGSPYAQQLTTGAGVTVAFIADGIDPNNPDFIRANGSHVIVDYQDFSGSGPDAPTGGGEAFGDASAIAAQGLVSHDLSQFVNAAYPLPAGCNIRILGVAPDASLVAIKAGGEFLTNSSILQSIDYAVRVDHVNVINESFGLSEFPDNSNRNTIQLFNDAAVAAGVTITESTGDGGVTGTIGSDSQDPKVISAAASTDSRLYAQTGYAGARAFGNGQWVSDNISALSSSGVTNYGRTPDLVAPGEAGWAACEPGFGSCISFAGQPTDIEAFGGTSQSSPLTAGVAALVISAYRSTHGGASPTPAVVKKIITGTATDLRLPPDEQGSGLLNANSAVEAALTYPGSSGAPSVPSRLITSTDQVTLTGNPGSTKSASVQVRNVGTSALTVAAGTRAFTSTGSSTQSVPFDSTTLPTFPYPTTGAPWAFKKVTFHVPTGTDRLLERIAWQGSRPTGDAVVRVSLFAPDGTYVANSRPQGGAASPNYANVDVRQPASGTWTAVLYSLSGSAGYTGSVSVGTSTFKAVPVGRVTPAVFTLAAGASKTVHFSMTLPHTASGDQDYAVTLGTSAGQNSAIGVVVRTLIDTSSGHGTFSGDVTGGNARGTTPGETFSYQFDVPRGQQSLDADIRFAQNPDSAIDLVLIDPNNELADVVTNETVTSDEQGLEFEPNIQSFTAAPIPGRWVLVVVVQNPVSGAALDQPFAGDVTFDPVPTHRGGLPNSASTKLTRGVTYTYQVTVHNSGVQPIIVGADPRLNKVVTLQPVPIQGQLTFALPPDPSQEPTYSIPPDTSRLTVAATSTTPAQLELQGSAAGFDLFGDLQQAENGNLLSVAKVGESGNGNYISKGIWFTNMQQIGPFTDAGPPAGSTTITASMRTLAFDTSTTSSTGDPFGNAVDPSNDGFGSPVYVVPGDTGTITVQITPTAASGKTVSGLLNLVTVANLPAGNGGLPELTTGEVIVSLPYAYRVR